MKITEVEKKGAFLTLEIDGVTREFFIKSVTSNYSDFSSSLVNAGDCVSFSATLAEIVETKYDSYGMQIYTSYEKYEYFQGWSGLNYVEDFKKLENPA